MRLVAVSDASLLPFDEPGHAGDACPDRPARAPCKKLVVALLVALFAVMASPAGATVRGLSKRDITVRHIPSSCPGADLQPTEKDLGRIRAATLCLVNRERAGQGENPLAANERLEQAAQGHTEGMAFGDYFKHVGPRGDTPLGRIRAARYTHSSQIDYHVGENIGWGALWLATPHAIVAAWMASPAHRANILDARFRDSAVGVFPHLPSALARSQSGAIYTQDFGG